MKFGYLLAIVGSIQACSSSRIFEREDGTFSVVSTGYYESSVYDAAHETALKRCQNLNKRPVLINEETQNPSISIKQTVKIGNTAPAADEKKVSLRFKCVK